MQSLFTTLFSSIILWNAGLNLHTLASDFRDSDENESSRKGQSHRKVTFQDNQLVLQNPDEYEPKKNPSPRTLARINEILTFYDKLVNLNNIVGIHKVLPKDIRKEILTIWKRDAFDLIGMAQAYTDKGYILPSPISRELEEIIETYQESPKQKPSEEEIQKSPTKPNKKIKGYTLLSPISGRLDETIQAPQESLKQKSPEKKTQKSPTTPGKKKEKLPKNPPSCAIS